MHDGALGISRLERGDDSTAIAATMHIFSAWVLTRAWCAATADGETPQAAQAAAGLRQISTGQRVRCSPQSEPGTDMLHPLVEATKVEGGWRLNGRKIFGTLSPVASLLNVACRIQDARGSFRPAYASVPRDSVGLDIKNNWDALGMRASGSHDIVFQDCFVPDTALREDGPWEAWTERFLSAQMVFNIGLVGAFLGIAEAARDLSVELLTTRRRALDANNGGAIMLKEEVML